MSTATPQFKINQRVNTPDGPGVVVDEEPSKRGPWYVVQLDSDPPEVQHGYYQYQLTAI